MTLLLNEEEKLFIQQLNCNSREDIILKINSLIMHAEDEMSMHFLGLLKDKLINGVSLDNTNTASSIF
jgi:hypothetical protein